MQLSFSDFLDTQDETAQQALRTFFEKFPEDTIIRVAQLLPGEFCMHQEDTDWDVYVLISGRVNIYTHLTDYSVYTLRDFVPFALFGHQELLGAVDTIVADVKASTECLFIVLSKETYLNWIHSDIEILKRQMQLAIQALMMQGSHDRNNLTLSRDVRLAMLLVNFYHENARNSGGTVTVTMNHNEIAETMGLSLRTINRVIADFKEQKLIDIHKGKITLTLTQIRKLQILIDI